MKISRIVNLFGLTVLAAGFISISSAAVTPTRVGPVSQYGQLQAGKNSQNYGRIYGSCKGVTAGNEVAVQGMSEHGEVRTKDAGGHGDNAQVHHNRCQYHLENLEAYGLDRGRESDANPVG